MSRSLKSFTFAAALCACPLVAQAKPAQCFLAVDGTVYIDKICDYDASGGDGSFSIGANGKSVYFAYLSSYEGIMTGNWNNGSSHAHEELGILHQTGACWSNDHARVCAWKIGERHD